MRRYRSACRRRVCLRPRCHSKFPARRHPVAPNGPQSSNPQANAATPTLLSLKEAEALALKNNPQISVARLTALASEQVTREVRSNLWPSATANLTGVDSRENSRITAGGLNNPIIYERAAAGVVVNQLITDFGRTTNLAASANYAAKAENQNAIATKEQILLAVDQAFYSALQAHAVLTVAQQTVSARQTVSDQVEALFKSKLRSQLDFSFASVNLAQAKLLLLDATNNQDAALAALSAVLGYPRLRNFQLIEDTTPVTSPPGNVDDLISSAFSMRPEILALDFEYRVRREVSIRGTRPVLSNDPGRRGCGGYASAQPRFVQLVRRGGRQRGHSPVQWLSLFGKVS